VIVLVAFYLTSLTNFSAPIYKSPGSETVDVEVTSRSLFFLPSPSHWRAIVVQGSEINNLHPVIGRVRKSSYFVELGLDDVKEKTSAKTGKHDCQWDENFIL
jgi:hypothetical protein